MNNKKGITLTSLAIIVVVMLLIVGASIYTGIDTINRAKKTRFNTELKVIHAKIEEMAEEDTSSYGRSISDQTSDIQAKIQTALGGASSTNFKYFERADLEQIGVTGIDRQVIINFSTWEVVDINGFETDEGYIYRMEDWRNKIRYENPNTDAPTFELSRKVYGITATIEVTNIEYKNDVAKGTIKYGEIVDGAVTNWKTGSTSITIQKSGMYRVQITDAAGNVAEKDIEVTLANKPKLVTGMIPVVYDESLWKWKVVDENSGDWYDYASDTKKWANAMTEDGLVVNDDGTIESFGSMWVWIPRYMYQIPAANYHTSTAGVINVKFLKGTTNIATDGSNVTIANASGGDNWNVHPAFCDGTANGFANGEWDRELTGMWVAKFEAGYASGNNNAPVVASNVKYSQDTVYARAVETGGSDEAISARNWLDGIYGVANTTAIKYPTFQPLTYSMNYINHNDAFLLAQDMTSSNNIYGFTSSTADTHLMKDSEWGMVAYFSQSQYGLNGTDIAVNNVNMNSGGTSTTKENGNAYASVYGITGVTRGSSIEGEYQVQSYSEVIATATNNNATSTDIIYKWNQVNGQKASSSGNIYGIYDLSGALWERTAAYVANGHSNISACGASIAAATGTKYAMTYSSSEVSGTTLNNASEDNYANSNNQLKYGNNIYETSTAGTGSTSWYGDYLYFHGLNDPFSKRGGGLWSGQSAGLFSLYRNVGNSYYHDGFRSVVVAL